MKKLIDFMTVVFQTMIPFIVCGTLFYYELYFVGSIQLIFCFAVLHSLYKEVRVIEKEIELLSKTNSKQKLDKIIQEEYSRSLQEIRH